MPEPVTSRAATPPPASPAATPDGRSGLALMARAAFWFSIMGLCVKLAAQALPEIEVVFVRSCITLALSAALLARAVARDPTIAPLGRRRGLLLLRGALGSGGLLCFFFAIANLPMAEATVIHQTSPLLTAVLAALLLGERLEGRVLASIAVCFAGVVLIARPGWLPGPAPMATDVDWDFAFVAALGASFAAGAYVAVRRLGSTEHPLVVVFYFPLVSVPLTAPFAVTQWVWPDATGWLLLAGVGASTQVAQIALTKGLARERAGRATSVGYLQIVFAAVWGVAFFDAWPDGWSLLGIALILLSLGFGIGRGRRPPGRGRT